jgi:prepilin-type N-terminal cleavage/methylation domain-containing protein
MREGFSLMELLVVITMLGVLSLVGGRIVTLFLESDASVSLDAARQLNLQRLEDRFRIDVHAALSVSVEEDGAEGAVLVLALPRGDEIRYVVQGERVDRQASGTTRVPARDRFVIAGGSVRFTADPPVVTLMIEPAEEMLDSPQTAFLAGGLRHGERIVARLGWDHRHSEIEAETEAEQ